MTKDSFNFFLKKPSELDESSELPASGLAKHPCTLFLRLSSIFSLEINTFSSPKRDKYKLYTNKFILCTVPRVCLDISFG